MNSKRETVLVIGFNTRPLAYSLEKAGYEVYAVDFFGDVDLYPCVKDCIIISKKLGAGYNTLKHNYQRYLVDFTIEILDKYPELENLIIASGLDDYVSEREQILNAIKKKEYKINNLNNNTKNIRDSRNIFKVYELMKEKGYVVPFTLEFNEFIQQSSNISYPIILKKKMSSGGVNVYKIENQEKFQILIKRLKNFGFNPNEWIIQEFIEGIPVSCTTISNGDKSIVISINRQIIGLQFLNPPKNFMYCGNIVPGNLLREDNDQIGGISIELANELELRGINGFDFVLKNNYPYLMEINPRIPGSIRTSEESLDLNLLELHVNSFNHTKWNEIVSLLDKSNHNFFATKLIIFAPKEVPIDQIAKINNLQHIHDKTLPNKKINKGQPICSILFKAKKFSDSYFGALKIADKINRLLL